MMNSTQPLYEILYISTLAPDTPISAIAKISRHARAANNTRQVTGLLVFDGIRFCQQFEGNKQQTILLIEKIKRDSRHTNVEILHHGELAERRFRTFSTGYSIVDDVDALEALKQLEGLPAVQALLKLAPSVDIGP